MPGYNRTSGPGDRIARGIGKVQVNADGSVSISPALSHTFIAGLGLTPIETKTANNSPTIDFTGLQALPYDTLLIRICKAKPQNNEQEFWIRVQTGGLVWQTGAAAYSWHNKQIVGNLDQSISNITDSKILTTHLASNVAPGNAAGKSLSGLIFFESPDDPDYMAIRFDGSYFRAADVHPTNFIGLGAYTTAGVITGIRFQFGTGNIVSGKFVLMGYKDS